MKPKSWFGLVFAIAAACLTTPAHAGGSAPSVTYVCAEQQDKVSGETRYLAKIDWGGAKKSDYHRFDLVAVDATGGYYPQWRDRNSGPNLPNRGFIVDDRKSKYPLEFVVAGLTSEAASAFDRDCKAKGNVGCTLEAGGEGVTIFGRSFTIASAERAPDCRTGSGWLAIVIGIGDYPATTMSVGQGSRVSFPPLAGAEADADRMHRALARLGYSVRRSDNPTALELAKAFEGIGDQTRRDAHKLVIYIAGHGFEYNNDLYAVAKETNINIPDVSSIPLSNNLLSLSRILTQLPRSTKGFNLIIMDMCRTFSNDFIVQSNELNMIDRNIAEVPSNTFVAYSTSAGRHALDEQGYVDAFISEYEAGSSNELSSFLSDVNARVRALDLRSPRDGTPILPRLWTNLSADNKVCLGPCAR